MARRLLEGALDPAAPLYNSEKLTHGAAAKRHPVLGFLIEDGIGSLPIEQQAEQFIQRVQQSHGKAAADVLRDALAAAKETP